MNRLPIYLIGIALCVASASSANNLIPNGAFDTNTAGWSVDTNTTAFTSFTWNANGSPPGSAHITNTASVTNGTTYVYSQCIAVNPSSTIALSGQIRDPSGQGTTGSGFIFVYWYREFNCLTGSAVRLGDGPTGTNGQLDVWNTYSISGVTAPSDARGARVGLILGKGPAGGSHSMLFDNIFLSATGGTTTAPAKVIASSFPSPLLVTANDPTAVSTSYTLTNTGETATTITLTRGGDQNGAFFTQSPSSFTLQPGASQNVTITSVTQNGAAALNGFSAVSGDGVAANFRVPIQLLASGTPSTTDVVAITSRVDVAAPIATNPTGSITFLNGSDATGILSSDVAWIVPQAGPIVLRAGQPTTVTFQIDRSRQPDASNPAGSLTGRIALAYLRGSASAKHTLDSPGSATSLVVPVTDTRQPATKADAVPPLGSGEVALLIPGIGHVTGSGGKEFISDVSILNSQSVAAVSDARLYYSSPAATVSAAQPVSASQAIQLSDVVNTYFAQGTSSQGTLHVRAADTSKLAVSANVFNKANPRGTYGTAIPVFRSNRAASSGETLALTGLRRDATSHTNLYLQEVSGAPAAAHIEFFDAGGASLGTKDSTVGAFGFAAVGSVVPLNGVLATVTNTSGGRLQAYATPVDDASGDTWAVADWNRQYAITGSEPMVIPVAGFAPGANGAIFRTDLAVTNIGSASATISLTYHPLNVTRTITLGRNQTRVVEDVTESLFGVNGVSVGSISAMPQNGGRFAVTSRTYTASPNDPATYGTGVPTLPLSGSLRSGQSQIFGGLEDTTLATVTLHAGNTFRTNVGLVETAGQSATVKLSVFFSDGLRLVAGAPNGTLTVSLNPHEFKQLNGIVRQIIGAERDTKFGDLHNVQLKVEVVAGSAGAVTPFLTATDNGTNDTALRTE